MNEAFLHYIWQFQYFDKKELLTSEGEPITISNPGYRNTHSGPDFYDAKLRIGFIEWAGSVEIHIQASGWREHKHQEDPAYENVVLHVVWDENETIIRKDGTLIPTLELKNRVSQSFLLQYKRIIHSRTKIPCANAIGLVPELIKRSMLDKALASRLEAKANNILLALQKSNADWEETCYQTLSKNFGFKVNTDPFLQLAQSLPYKILMKHGDKLEQIEPTSAAAETARSSPSKSRIDQISRIRPIPSKAEMTRAVVSESPKRKNAPDRSSSPVGAVSSRARFGPSVAPWISDQASNALRASVAESVLSPS